MSALALTPERRLAIWHAVSVDCLTFKQCGDLMRVSPEEARRIYEEVSQENESRFITRAEARREIRAQQLDDIRARSVRTFELSGKPRKKKVVEKLRKRKETEGGEVYFVDGDERTTETIEQHVPDPRFLNTAIAAITKISDLQGLDAPKQVHVTEHSVHDVYLELRGKTSEELEQLAQIERLRAMGILKDKVIEVIPQKKEEPPCPPPEKKE